MFNSILENGLTTEAILICTAVSLGLGLLIAGSSMVKSTYNKNFVITLTLIPVIIQAIILLVNGNIGTGVAVLGAFSLVRFRSVPGNSKDILCIFFAVTVGIAAGIGQIAFAAVFTVLVCAVFIVLKLLPVGESGSGKRRTLRITVPEDCEFDKAFEEVFARHTTSHKLERVKTSNLGSLYVVEYCVTLKSRDAERQLIDDLRVRNGNLSIVCTVYHSEATEL